MTTYTLEREIGDVGQYVMDSLTLLDRRDLEYHVDRVERAMAIRHANQSSVSTCTTTVRITSEHVALT